MLRSLACLPVFAASGHCHAEPAVPPYAQSLGPQIEDVLRRTLTPGAVVIVKSPKGDWEQAFGTRTRGGKDPVGIDDHFRVGSVTKTWTGTVILQLAQQGRLKLSDPISKYVPQVPNGKAITIEHLLGMRSGLANYSEDAAFLERLDREPHHVYRPQQLLVIAFRHRPSFAPGERYEYSNTNTVLLGMVIEKVTGKAVALEMRQRLFRPLGLHHTYLPPSNHTRLPVPRSHGYQYGPNAHQTGSGEGQAGTPPNASALLRDASNWNMSWAWTAGMGVSNARELARYARHLVEGTYLAPELHRKRLEQCSTPENSEKTAPAVEYCLGIAKFGNFYGHTGDIPGFTTVMLHDPGTKTTVIVWASRSSDAAGLSPAAEIGKLISAEFSGSRP
jgi:D-alanyl-D-alanine carboxypeptidase